MAESQGWGSSCRVLPWGSHQHSGNFLELGVKCLCTVQPATPVPSPPLQASHLFRVSTCPWFPSQLMQIPQYSFTFSSLRRGFTDSLSPPWQNSKHFFPSDLLVLLCLKPSSLPSRACLIRVKVCGDRFCPAGLVLSMGMPHWQPPGSSIYNTSWCSDTHLKTFSNNSPEVCGARSAALPRLCHLQLNWEQLHTPPMQSRRFPAGPGRQLWCRKSIRPGPGQGKVSGQRKKGHPPILMATGSATSCKNELWELCICNAQTFILHPYWNIARISHYLQALYFTIYNPAVKPR